MSDSNKTTTSSFSVAVDGKDVQIDDLKGSTGQRARQTEKQLIEDHGMSDTAAYIASTLG